MFTPMAPAATLTPWMMTSPPHPARTSSQRSTKRSSKDCLLEAVLTDPQVTASYAADMASFCAMRQTGRRRPAPDRRAGAARHAHRDRTACPRRPPRRPYGPVRRCQRLRGLHRALPGEDGPDPGGQRRRPDRRRRARCGQRRPLARRRRTGPVLPARPLQLGTVHHRRQHRHRVRRPVLRQVRGHRRIRPRPRRGPRRRAAAAHRLYAPPRASPGTTSPACSSAPRAASASSSRPYSRCVPRRPGSSRSPPSSPRPRPPARPCAPSWRPV